eukprot:360555-Chlamydomonas_euryale.AAC.4
MVFNEGHLGRVRRGGGQEGAKRRVGEGWGREREEAWGRSLFDCAWKTDGHDRVLQAQGLDEAMLAPQPQAHSLSRNDESPFQKLFSRAATLWRTNRFAAAQQRAGNCDDLRKSLHPVCRNPATLYVTRIARLHHTAPFSRYPAGLYAAGDSVSTNCWAVGHRQAPFRIACSGRPLPG